MSECPLPLATYGMAMLHSPWFLESKTRRTRAVSARSDACSAVAANCCNATVARLLASHAGKPSRFLWELGERGAAWYCSVVPFLTPYQTWKSSAPSVCSGGTCAAKLRPPAQKRWSHWHRSPAHPETAVGFDVEADIQGVGVVPLVPGPHKKWWFQVPRSLDLIPRCH